MATFSNFDANVTDYKGGYKGPFYSSGGKIYVLYRGSSDTDDLIVNWTDSSTPSSATWSAISTNAPNGNSTTGIQWIEAVQEDDELHVYWQAWTSGTIYYSRFDMASGTNGAWVDLGTSQYEIAVATISHAGRGGHTISISDPRAVTGTIRRGNGDICCVYQGDEHSSMGKRYGNIKAKISTDDGATWGTEFSVSDASGAVEYLHPKAVCTSNNRIHIFFTEADGTVFVSSLRATDTSISISSPDNFQIDTTANSGRFSDIWDPLSRPLSFDDAGIEKVKIAYVNNVFSGGAILEFDDADTPASFSTNEVTAQDIEDTEGIYAISFAVDGTDEYLSFVNFNTKDIEYDLNDGTDETAFTVTAASINSGIYNRSGKKLGFFYLEDLATDAWNFGEVDIDTALQLTFTSGISSTVSFGSHTISPGPVTLTFGSIVSSITYGEHTLAISQELIFPLISSTITYGNQEVSPGPVNLNFIGISSTNSFGNHVLEPQAVNITITGFNNLVTFGSLEINPGPVTLNLPSISNQENFENFDLDLNLIISSISSTLNFGNHQLNPGSVNLTLPIIDSTITFGNHQVSAGSTSLVFPTIESTLTFGDHQLEPGPVTLEIPSLDNIENLITPELDLNLIMDVILSSISFENLQLDLNIELLPISSTLNLGSHQIEAGSVNIILPSIGSTLTFGSHQLIPGAVTLEFPSLDNIENLSTPQLDLNLVMSIISSTVNFESLQLNLNIELPSVNSTTQLTTPIITSGISLVMPSIGSTVSFGSHQLIPGPVTLSVPSIGSTFDLEDHQLDLNLIITEIISSLNLEAFQLDLNIELTNISSTKDFGDHQLDLNLNFEPIVSTLSFGNHSLTSDNSLVVPNIVSTLSFGNHSLTSDAVLLVPPISSTLSFGSHQLDLNIGIPSIDSDLSMGTFQLDLNLDLNSIISSVDFGDHQLDLNINLNSLDNNTVLTPPLILQGQTLVMPSIGSTLQFENHQVNPGSVEIELTSIISELNITPPTIQVGITELIMSNISNVVTFGTHSLSQITIIVPTINSTVSFSGFELIIGFFRSTRELTPWPKSTYKQTITLWKKSYVDNYGSTVFSLPVKLKGKWEDDRTLKIDAQGEEFTSLATVWVSLDLESGDFIYLGDSDETNPYLVPKAREIRNVVKIPGWDDNEWTEVRAIL